MDWQAIEISRDFVAGLTEQDAAEQRFLLVFSDGELLVPEHGPFRPLDEDEFRWLGVRETARHLLGHVAGIPLLAVTADLDADEPDSFVFEPLRSFLGEIDDATFSLLSRAKQVVDWDLNHRFCGACGKPAMPVDGDRARRCNPCNRLFYPRIAPSIIVLVSRGDDLLLARNARARGNFYSTLAGFVEPGESMEEAVHREVLEEVGVRIRNLRYFGSQSWPFPNSLMLGFHADYDSGELVLQEDEIADAGWYHFRDLPRHPGQISISGWLIRHAVEQLERAQG